MGRGPHRGSGVHTADGYCSRSQFTLPQENRVVQFTRSHSDHIRRLKTRSSTAARKSRGFRKTKNQEVFFFVRALYRRKCLRARSKALVEGYRNLRQWVATLMDALKTEPSPLSASLSLEV